MTVLKGTLCLKVQFCFKRKLKLKMKNGGKSLRQRFQMYCWRRQLAKQLFCECEYPNFPLNDNSMWSDDIPSQFGSSNHDHIKRHCFKILNECPLTANWRSPSISIPVWRRFFRPRYFQGREPDWPPLWWCSPRSSWKSWKSWNYPDDSQYSCSWRRLQDKTKWQTPNVP